MENVEKKSYVIHPIQGHECLSACIGNVLHAECSQMSGNDIVIDGEGCRVTYNQAARVIGSSMYKSNFNFLKRYGFRYCHEIKDNVLDAKTYLDRNLAEGKYFITKVDASQLTYNRVFSQTKDAPHFINILEKTNEGYRICDGYVPTRKAEVFEGFIAEDVLMNAWGNKNYEFVVIDGIPANLTDVKNCIADKFSLALTNFCEGGCEEGIFRGYDAISNAFLDFQNDFTKDRAYELNYQFRINGVLASKEIILGYMKSRSDLQKFIEQYESIIIEWDGILMNFMKIAFSQKKDRYKAFLDKVNHCLIREIELYKDILRSSDIKIRIIKR